ncbi:MAG TPA: hypothetical protein VFV50_07185 [Bdellovibrionales bacterium]|nr:hypothetical protein [Bdellovibrionales bacterium]
MNINRFVLFNAFIVILLIYVIFRSRKRPQPAKFDFGPKRLDGAAGRRERELNCFFDYQGEKLDAYEVLDVPAGAPDDLVRDALRRSLSGARDAASRSRAQAAFDALRAQRGSL